MLAIQSVAPCLVFLDEIDAISPKRETTQREMERRIVAQLLSCMDGKQKEVHWDNVWHSLGTPYGIME